MKPELFTDLEDISSQSLGLFIQFLNILEGYKTRIKNLHWAATALNIHVKLDELLDTVNDYQDSIAEESMGIHGQMASNVIQGVSCVYTDPNQLLDSLLAKTQAFYTKLTSNEYSGMRSETEVFIHELNKFKYLFKLCK